MSIFFVRYNVFETQPTFLHVSGIFGGSVLLLGSILSAWQFVDSLLRWWVFEFFLITVDATNIFVMVFLWTCKKIILADFIDVVWFNYITKHWTTFQRGHAGRQFMSCHLSTHLSLQPWSWIREHMAFVANTKFSFVSRGATRALHRGVGGAFLSCFSLCLGRGTWWRQAGVCTQAAPQGRLAHPRLRGRLTSQVLHWRMDARYSGSPRAHSCQRQLSRTWVEASWCPPSCSPSLQPGCTHASHGGSGTVLPALKRLWTSSVLSARRLGTQWVVAFSSEVCIPSLGGAVGSWVSSSPLLCLSIRCLPQFQDEACRCLEALIVSLRD